MKVVLFCGGYGMRMRDSSGEGMPKPMQMVGPRPLIWHVMRYYAHFGHKDFILCLGYGASHIKNYFLTYQEATSNDFVIHGGQIELMRLRHQRLEDHLCRHWARIRDRSSDFAESGPTSKGTSTSSPTTPMS